jgi:hypothetical protein
VLHIEGDLIKANIIEQHNFLGDSDQIQLMLDDFLAAGTPSNWSPGPMPS